MKWFLWDIRNLLIDYGIPIVFMLAISVIATYAADQVGTGVKTFVQDVHTIAESIEKGEQDDTND